MQKICQICAQGFQIDEDDLKFFEQAAPVFGEKKFPLPHPKLCPSCRSQRRMSYRNETTLYLRKCDKTGQEIISTYSQDKPYKVFSHKVWAKDDWDPLDYGRDFDFNRPFFEQFYELQK